MGTRRVSVGWDPAQRSDYSALCVTETDTAITDWRCSHPFRHEGLGHDDTCKPIRDHTFRVGEIGRLPRGVPYTEQAAYVARVVRRLNERGLTPKIYLDSTGLGGPVHDLAREALAGLSCVLRRVTFTGGETFHRDGSRLTVGKGYLVTRLVVLFQQGRIKMPRNRQTKALRQELLDYTVERTGTGTVVAAARTGSHDDMVTALGLTVLDEPWRWLASNGPQKIWS